MGRDKEYIITARAADYRTVTFLIYAPSFEVAKTAARIKRDENGWRDEMKIAINDDPRSKWRPFK